MKDLKDSCIFCNIPTNRIVLKDKLSYSIFDQFPVSKGHALIIPYRHVSSFFDLTDDEYLEIRYLINEMKLRIDHSFSPTGYNIGINIGATAGQSIQHVHIHLIPRFTGDVPDPFGGVRNVIPDKGRYPLADE
jgi:diadenosine tetraphosphate (Ap4A) HIT family hydrolase